MSTFNIPQVHIIVILFILGFGIAGYVAVPQNSAQPKAIKGVLDLSDWDFETDGIVNLSGQYEFYWKQYISQSGFSNLKNTNRIHYIDVPSYWNGTDVDGTRLTGTGYATYRLTVILKDSLQNLAFKFLDMGTAYSVFVDNKEILSIGNLDMSPETTRPEYFPQIVEFTPDSSSFELVYHVANFHHYKGGAWEAIRLGLKGQVYSERERRLSLDMVLYGSILIMGLYHIAIFILRRKDMSSLYFGVFCILISMRVLTTTERFLLHIFPNINWQLFVKLEYLSFYLAVVAVAAFIESLFKSEINKWVLGFIYGTGLIFSAIICLTPVKVFSQTLLPYELFTLFGILYVLFVVIKAALKKRMEAIIFLAGFLCLTAAFVNDILDVHLFIQTGHFIHLGLYFFIFSQAFLLSYNHSLAYETVDKQREQLTMTNLNYQAELAERKLAEQKLLKSKDALCKSEAKNRALLNVIPDAMFRISSNGICLEFITAEGFETLVSSKSLIGENITQILPAAFATQCMHFVKKTLSSGHIQIFEYEVDSVVEKRNYEMRIVVSGTDEVLAIIRDTTERKRLLEDLQRAQRLETAGRLAGQIAHDFNNLLSPITAYPALIREGLPSGHSAIGMIEEIEFSASKIAQINQQLLSLGRRGHYTMEPVDLNDLIHKVVLSLNLPKEFVIREQFTHNLFLVLGGAAQLTRVISNLITNSSEAIQGSGIITLKTKNIYLDNPVKGYKLIRPGEYVQFIINDTGSGIDPEIVEKLFDPFFTTKKMAHNRGTGLGLSIVHSIMEDHNGYTTVESELGIGTTFTLYFPVTRDEKLNSTVEIINGGDERVLIIDDDAIQRKVATQVLERLGYEVNSVESGEEAVNFVRKHPQDLLVLDMVMDGIDGTETYRQILEFHPEQRAIILSGNAVSKKVEEALRLGVGSFVAKPVNINSLISAVRKELDKKSSVIFVNN